MNKIFATAALSLLLVGSAQAEGNLAANGTDLPELIINMDDIKFSQNEYQLETGKYYRIKITCDESADDTAFLSPELFRNIWINQITINDLEWKGYGVYSLECDVAGTFNLSFVPIRPGEYDFYVPGYEDRGLKGKFIVK